MIIYLSGAIAQDRIKAVENFKEAENRIKKAFPMGIVINPIELSSPEQYRGNRWQQCLKRDIIHMVQADYVVLLEGWELSPGASFEKYIAELLGIETCLLENFIQTENSDISTDIDKPKALDFNLLFRQIVLWQQETFGKRTDPRPPIHHLEKEVKKLLENPFDLMEYADCLFLLFNAADIADFSPEQLVNAVKDKFEINKQRKWGKPDSQGVVLHVKE